jgi:hypothetical protein
MRRVKILLLGDSNVGKTSIIARLTTGDFKTKMVQTVGVDYKPKKVNIGGENIQVLILSPHLSSFFPSPPLSGSALGYRWIREVPPNHDILLSRSERHHALLRCLATRDL